MATPCRRAAQEVLYYADQAGALGYHELTAEGQPVSKIFVKMTLAGKQLVSVTASHELFEMVIDPVANLWAEAADGTEYAYEMSDPVEEDTFLVDGVAMSNFVHPSWFEPFKHPPGTKFDHLGLLKKPFSMTTGGYMILKKKGKVSQVFGSKAKGEAFREGRSIRSSQRISKRCQRPAHEAREEGCEETREGQLTTIGPAKRRLSRRARGDETSVATIIRPRHGPMQPRQIRRGHVSVFKDHGQGRVSCYFLPISCQIAPNIRNGAGGGRAREWFALMIAVNGGALGAAFGV